MFECTEGRVVIEVLYGYNNMSVYKSFTDLHETYKI